MDDDFAEIVEPHRARLRFHCYRMLGSSHDADDMVQETFVRAFRSRHSLREPAAAHAWLHRIATNVCLDELAKRPRRARGPEVGPPADPDEPPPAATPDDEWIEPCPWTPAEPEDPAARYTLDQSVALAFVAALQVLTPVQRAVLLLRDVVGLSARETATALEISVSAANSLLHRARAALAERVGTQRTVRPDPESPVDRALLARYMAAWSGGDVEEIVALLHEDATFSMPPVPYWLDGRDAIARFLIDRVCETLASRQLRTVSMTANGRPAVAFYRARGSGPPQLFAVHLVELRNGRIATIDHFLSASSHAAFFAAGVAKSLAR